MYPLPGQGTDGDVLRILHVRCPGIEEGWGRVDIVTTENDMLTRWQAELPLDATKALVMAWVGLRFVVQPQSGARGLSYSGTARAR